MFLSLALSTYYPDALLSKVMLVQSKQFNMIKSPSNPLSRLLFRPITGVSLRTLSSYMLQAPGCTVDSNLHRIDPLFSPTMEEKQVTDDWASCRQLCCLFHSYCPGKQIDTSCLTQYHAEQSQTGSYPAPSNKTQ